MNQAGAGQIDATTLRRISRSNCTHTPRKGSESPSNPVQEGSKAFWVGEDGVGVLLDCDYSMRDRAIRFPEGLRFAFGFPSLVAQLGKGLPAKHKGTPPYNGQHTYMGESRWHKQRANHAIFLGAGFLMHVWAKSLNLISTPHSYLVKRSGPPPTT